MQEVLTDDFVDGPPCEGCGRTRYARMLDRSLSCRRCGRQASAAKRATFWPERWDL